MKLNLRRATTVDFETFPIEPRPDYPPRAVGVAIRWPNGKAEYLAWGHPGGGNTHTLEQAKRALLQIARGKGPVLFWHGKFDLCVWESLGVPTPSIDRVHDPMYAAFLVDPRAPSYELKPWAARKLGEPPAERDAVIDWLVEHQPVLGIKLVAKKPKNKAKADSKTRYAGAYVAYAPVPLVAKYAIGDVDRTWKLGQVLADEICKRNMVRAYRREVDLIEPIMNMEERGVPVDANLLGGDVRLYEDALRTVHAWLCKRLKAPDEVNWDSNEELIQYMLRAGVATAASLGRTKTGKVQTNKDALARGVTDPRVLAVLKYRSRVVSSLDTFMRPWLAVARRSGGRIFTTWYTTRHDEHGARTGRMASSPNLQNMTKRKVKLFDGEPPAWWKKLGLPDLPFVRRYVVAERGHVLIDRDKSQQEIRIFAHYEDGPLLKAYNVNPWLDLYNEVLPKVNALLVVPITRDDIKTTVLAKLYGMGVGLLATRLRVDVATAKSISDAVVAAVPGLKHLLSALKEHTSKGLPIRTWGGREYFLEPPKMVKGELRNMSYKLLNDLIQPSAADDLKECILWWWRHAPRKWHLLLTVHDELVVSAPAADLHRAMALLKRAMNHVVFDVPMLSEGKYGPNMATLEPYDKKGVDVWNERKAA